MSTNRKIFIASAVLALAAIGLGIWVYSIEQTSSSPSSSSSSGRQIWKYSIFGPPRAFTRGIERVKEILEEAGGGDFELQIHYASALVPAREHLDAIEMGLIESGVTCIGYHHRKTPLAQVLELPFLMTDDIVANAQILDAVFSHPLIEEELARWNAKYFFSGVLPSFEFMGNRRIAGVDDLQGVRMRISGANQTLLQMFGSVSVMVTAPETYTALERGTIDMVGFPWTYAHGAYRLYEVSRYATDGMAMTGFACINLVSIDAWEALPAPLQALLPRLRREAVAAMLRGYEEADAIYLPLFRKTLEVVPFPESERRKLIAASEKIWDQWAAERDAQGLAGTEILQFTKEQVAKFGNR